MNVKLQLHMATQALCRCWCSKTPAVYAVMCVSLGDGARLDPPLLPGQVFEVLLNNVSMKHLLIYLQHFSVTLGTCVEFHCVVLLTQKFWRILKIIV